MPAKEYEGRRELRVATGMILSSTVLGKLASLPRRDWTDPAMKVVDEMCCRFFEKNGKAPKKSIVNLFASWSETHRYKDDVPPVERIIQQVIESDPPNSQLCIDEALALFAENRAAHGIKVAQGQFADGKVDDALRTLAEAAEPIKAGTSSVTFLSDAAETKNAFSESTRSIIQLPDGIGQFFGDSLEEDGFISFLAPQGRGKSFFLLEMAHAAMTQRKKVAYFQIGDMTKRQLYRRFHSRIAAWPVRSPNGHWPCKVNWPASLTVDGVTHKELEFDKPLNDAIALKAYAKLKKHTIRSADEYLAMSCHESFSITVNGIRSVMRELSRSGFDPAVVVLDYADNLAPVNSKIEVRHQLHQTWGLLRALSMEHHVLLVTATQSTRMKNTANDTKPIRMDNTSEDIRKVGEVTGLVGIGQNDTERRNGLYRINWADKLRDQAADVGRQCYIASCLPLANPAVLSIYPTYDQQRKAKEEK